MATIADFIIRLKKKKFYDGQIVHCENLPPSLARYGELETALSPILQRILSVHRLGPLYTHQTQAVNLIRSGDNVVVCTSSASGKSMCYNLPVMQSMLEEKQACAFYLFPTKALAQDQLGKIKHLFSPDVLPVNEFDTYDGDTPTEDRAGIRRTARLILTNPDMLHVSILQNHRTWSRFLRNLRYVVVDEAHIYRGVFGSHVALILRRLRRLCAAYGSVPQFILCSATIDNPEEHAESLTGLSFFVVDDDGSPKGGKDFVLWNPPLIDTANGTRRSANAESSDLFSSLIGDGIRSICFTRTRRLAELIADYVRKKLSDNASSYASRVKTYRAGYTAGERRRIEQELSCGALMGVVATNALELGVDIGDLDATVITGYPGTISSTWQQSGRSGRRDTRSLSFLIGLDNPLDQYLMRHPQYFFGQSYENVTLNPTNPYIMGAHLLCAAWERALGSSDARYFGNTMLAEVQALAKDGLLCERREHYYLSPTLSYPAGEVSIRSASGTNFALTDGRNGKILEVLDSFHAFTQAHSGAVYLHQGESYVVAEFDLLGKTIKVVPNTDAYYTVSKEITDVRVLRVHKEKALGAIKVYLGEVDVSLDVVGYKKKKLYTEEILGEELLTLPTQRFSTIGLWFDIPQKARERISLGELDFDGGLHATEHATIGILPLFAMCDRNDIGGLSTPLHPDTGASQIFIYDACPGGVGITEKGFELISELWDATLTMVNECQCHDGCPSCIQSPKCGNNNQPLDKQAALILLEELKTRTSTL
ncbi:MAG: DEAD/DEAH box helicase [Dehalococcoidia bacterium]|nr:DEAD/DEAH box helicase [Dehalococcoidia bacterium]